MLYVRRRETFSASHRLHNPQLSDEENAGIFGKCNNPNGHGHNYVLEVTVAGDVDPKTGYVIDLKILKKIINTEIISKLDHANLNVDVDFLKGRITSTENIVKAIWEKLQDKMPSGKLYCVRLAETEKNFVEYKGE